MNQKKTTTFRMGAQTYEIIRYTVVQSEDKYDSVTEFIQCSITHQAPKIFSVFSGGQQARQLIRLLASIRGLDEGVPKDSTEATIKNEDVSDKTVTVELTQKQLGILNDIQDDTGLNSISAIIRRCLFSELHQLSISSNVLLDWQAKWIDRTWCELQNGLVLSKSRCYEVLNRRFVVQYDSTERMIELDLNAFNDFAEEYSSNFLETDCYTSLKEEYGTSAFTNVENTIEAKTEYEIDEKGTLESFLEGAMMGG